MPLENAYAVRHLTSIDGHTADGLFGNAPLDIDTSGNIITSGNITVPVANSINLQDTNHGMIYSATVDGPLFKGFAGFLWGIGASGADERMRLTDASGLRVGLPVNSSYNAGWTSTNATTIGSAAKASSPSGGQGTLLFYSNDASNRFEGSISFITDATAANRRLAITAVEQNVSFRNITLAESGGNVGIGIAVPTSLLHVAGAIATVGIVSSSDIIITSGGFTLSQSNAGIEIGSLASANTPFIDFHSNGTSHDYDVRIIANGGSGTDGQGGLTINCLTSDFVGTSIVTQQWADAGTTGPSHDLYHNSASPAIGDKVGLLHFYGNDNAANKTLYGEISIYILQTTNGTEYGCIRGQVMNAGALSDTTLATETFLLGYANPASNNFEYVFRAPNGKQGYMYMESFDTGASGPSLILWHNCASSQAVNDFNAYIAFDGQDSGGAYQTYCSIDSIVLDPTAASEDSKLQFETTNAGATAARGFIGQGLVMGSPTGGDKGAGTVNAVTVYGNGTALTCYPWESAKTGKIDLEYWDSMVPDTIIPAKPRRVIPGDEMRGRAEVIYEAEPERVIKNIHAPARKFAARLGTKYDPTTISGQRAHLNDKRHLTVYPNPEKYTEENRPSLDSWVQSGVEMDELNFIYIDQLERRVAQLEENLKRMH